MRIKWRYRAMQIVTGNRTIDVEENILLGTTHCIESINTEKYAEWWVGLILHSRRNSSEVSHGVQSRLSSVHVSKQNNLVMCIKHSIKKTQLRSNGYHFIINALDSKSILFHSNKRESNINSRVIIALLTKWMADPFRLTASKIIPGVLNDSLINSKESP